METIKAPQMQGFGGMKRGRLLSTEPQKHFIAIDHQAFNKFPSFGNLFGNQFVLALAIPEAENYRKGYRHGRGWYGVRDGLGMRGLFHKTLLLNFTFYHNGPE